MNKDKNKRINVNDIEYGVVSNGIVCSTCVPACGTVKRGVAAIKRQVQDNNGGPKNSRDYQARNEWNNIIHCRVIGPHTSFSSIQNSNQTINRTKDSNSK